MNQELRDKIIELVDDAQSKYFSSDPEYKELQTIHDMLNQDYLPALPVIGTYGNYSGDNYGAHTLKVQVNGLVLFYSYRSIVAYQDWKDGLVVSTNRWGTTTGKHLNWIQADHKKRVSNFDERLAAALERHGLRE